MSETIPRLFISYSWTNPEFEDTVLKLATALRESGVDVILDKWELSEGDDAIQFMERMVTDPTVEKVLIVCDRLYAAKADGRDGGVGAETQIISPEIYSRAKQDKFVVAVMERDDKGEPCLPVYYKSRIYIDLSIPEDYGEGFEKLLRWIFNKPLYEKPDIGKRPTFLEDPGVVTLGTGVRQRVLIDAIRSGKSSTLGALDEYLSTMEHNFERLRISHTEEPFDELVTHSIDGFLPQRDEVVEVFVTLSRYGLRDELLERIAKSFELLIPFMWPPVGAEQYYEDEFDNFKFIIHELYLYLIASLIKNERFSEVACLLERGCYFSSRFGDPAKPMVRFTAFRRHLQSLDIRNKRLATNRISLRADLLKQRSASSSIDFQELMQADFLLFMRAEFENFDQFGWYPETLLYSTHIYRPFEIFARSMSKKYFDRLKSTLMIQTPSDLKGLLDAYRGGLRKLPFGQFDFNPVALLGFTRLATQP